MSEFLKFPTSPNFDHWRSPSIYKIYLILGSFFYLSATLFITNISAQESKEREEDSPSGSENILAGHSFHGEAFNEGPRQGAYLMGGTGNVSFEVTTDIALAQQFFNQAIGQLHGFWYFEAERSFRQVAKLDNNCAMAYWGMAMANQGQNAKRAAGFIKEAIKRKEGVTRREQLWIDGLDTYLKAKKKNDKNAKREYIRHLEEIIHEFPDDIEAKAFLAVHLWQFNGALPISSHQAVDSILDQVFDLNPMHPAHHYRIHLWDREKPERALGSAARGGQSGPSIAHLWHMPGHIYSRLKRYRDAVWQQEASSRADHAHMMRDRVLPDQIHNYAHNQEWMTRNLIHIGRSRDALAIASNLVEHPRHPKYNTATRRGRSAAYGRTRLFQALERFEMWDQLIKLTETMYLEPTDIQSEQDKRIRALGIAYFEKGESIKLMAQLVDLQGRLAKSRTEQKNAMDKAVKDAKKAKKPQTEIEKAKSAAAKRFDNRIKSLNDGVAELNAYAGLLVGTKETAGTLLDQVNGIPKDRLARLYLRVGDQEKAERLAREAVDSAKNEVLPLANQVSVLFSLGKKKEASEAFAKLREISGDIDDLTLPPFERLSEVARDLDFPKDWRVTKPLSSDVGVRPSLDSIGPLRYSPSKAPSWSLSNGSGEPITLKQYKGQPVVVIFYLGHGCLHCIEQLTTFAPKTNEFTDAGISLVAISTDEVNELQKSIKNYQVEIQSKLTSSNEKESVPGINEFTGEFPFPLVSDSELSIFKAYRAFDDFEEQPLHGTFLIDGDGLVRWHDISYEPFNDPDFLLKESKRLLQLPVKSAGSFALGGNESSIIKNK